MLCSFTSQIDRYGSRTAVAEMFALGQVSLTQQIRRGMATPGRSTAAALEAELAVLQKQDEERLGRWITSSMGPLPSPSTTAIESRLAELAPDRRAVKCQHAGSDVALHGRCPTCRRCRRRGAVR
jgi:hypothetical protein